MADFFTADHHFGHENIIRYTKRPFGSAAEMDEELIRRWNERVGAGDTVYHLGDFALADGYVARGYFARLRGRIRVLGNPWHHDRYWLGAGDLVSATGSPVEVLPPMAVLEYPEFGDGIWPKVLVLCHYPLLMWDRRHYGSWHVHGHCHGRLSLDRLDVGVDCTDFYPLRLDEVAERMKGMGR